MPSSAPCSCLHLWDPAERIDDYNRLGRLTISLIEQSCMTSRRVCRQSMVGASLLQWHESLRSCLTCSQCLEELCLGVPVEAWTWRTIRMIYVEPSAPAKIQMVCLQTFLCSACLMYAQEELRAFLKPPVSHCIPCSHVLLGVGITSSYCFEVSLSVVVPSPRDW